MPKVVSLRHGSKPLAIVWGVWLSNNEQNGLDPGPHLAIHEHDGIEGLVLGRCRDISLHREVRQKGLHFLAAHFPRMAFVVKKDEPFDSGNVGHLGSVGKMFQTAGSGHIFEEKRSRRLGEFWKIKKSG